MSRTRTIVVAYLLAVVVAWGCSRTPTAAPASTSSRGLEARVSKLEQDLKAAETAAAQAKERWQQEFTRGQVIEKERDDLRAGLKAKAAERDVLQARLDGIQKLLKEALGQMETAAAPQPGSLPSVELPKPSGF